MILQLTRPASRQSSLRKHEAAAREQDDTNKQRHSDFKTIWTRSQQF